MKYGGEETGTSLEPARLSRQSRIQKCHWCAKQSSWSFATEPFTAHKMKRFTAVPGPNPLCTRALSQPITAALLWCRYQFSCICSQGLSDSVGVAHCGRTDQHGSTGRSYPRATWPFLQHVGRSAVRSKDNKNLTDFPTRKLPNMMNHLQRSRSACHT